MVIGQQRNVSASSEEGNDGKQQREVANRRRSEGVERHGGQRDRKRMARTGGTSSGATVRRDRQDDAARHVSQRSTQHVLRQAAAH